MKHNSLLTILLIGVLCMAGLQTGNAYAQRLETTLLTAQTLLPATAVYAPDGTASADSAWIINSKYDPNLVLSLFVLPDSTTGYSADTLAIHVVYGPDDATTGYYPLNLTTQVLCNQKIVFGSVPADSGAWITWTPPPHDRRRYYFTNTLGDTMLVSAKEYATSSAPFRR